tara:strand:+ start:1471 stop:2631 length:1161 start_codon:yes stop_codon:yes gene_type:complete
MLPDAARAGDFGLRGSITPELRVFSQTPSNPRQKDTTLSIAGEVTAKYLWDNNDQSFIFTPFARLDQNDRRRSHWDIREARYAYYAGDWEFHIGAGKVFWGVTEAVHLVDVVNQTDVIEDPVKQEVKLGQPMVRVRTVQSFGTLDLFYLPYFREQTYPGKRGRPATDIPVDPNLTTYESGRGAWHPDFAARYSNHFGEFDLGLGYFQGTARDPILSLAFNSSGTPVLAPFYPQMKQASLDLQATIGAWLYKFEGYGRRELGDTYAAATGGIEYTFYGIFGGAGDLGTVVEYAYDTRGQNFRNAYQNDAFFALRWGANDVASTSLLGGIVIDTQTGATGLRFEGSRRLGDDYSLSVEAYAFTHVPAEDPVYSIADDDYLQIRVARFF